MHIYYTENKLRKEQDIIMKIFKNGKIITMKDNKTAEAMVIKNDLIHDIGSNSYIMEKYTKLADKEIDLEEKTIIPGFNDGHMHLYQYALTKSKVNLTGVKTTNDIKKRIDKHINKLKLGENEWLEGNGWNEDIFPEEKIFTKNSLDKFPSNNPVLLKRHCFHVAMVNSKALELSNINKNTKDPEGGKIGRDSEGNPNGILYDEAISLVEKNIPKKNVNQIKKLFKDAFKDLSRAGLSSIQTDDFINVEYPEIILQAYNELNNEGELPVRINLQMRLKTVEKIREFASKGMTTGKGDKYYRLGPVKLITDGSLGAHTAALLEPYTDEAENTGTLLYEDEKLNELVLEAYKNEFQIATHAIGDRALAKTLKAYEKAIKKTKKDKRPVVVHVQIGNKELYEKMQELKVIATVQPVFVRSDWSVCEKRVGKMRGNLSYAWKTLLDTGVKVVGSSDAPIEPFDPLYGIYTAVCRKDFDENPEKGWHPQEKLNIMEALKLFTVNAAFASFEEDIKGSLKPGKLADFIILSDDITEIKSEKIKDIDVLRTYVGGREVYKKNN